MRFLPLEFRVVLSFFAVLTAGLLGLVMSGTVAANLSAAFVQIPASALTVLSPPSVQSAVWAVRIEALALAFWAVSWSLDGKTLQWWSVGTKTLGLLLLLWLGPWILFYRTVQAFVLAHGGTANPLVTEAVTGFYLVAVLVQVLRLVQTLGAAGRSNV